MATTSQTAVTTTFIGCDCRSHIVAFGTAPGTDDVWCLDHTGVVTLAITKETYERLGIVGTKSPWKARPDIHSAFLLSIYSAEC